MSIIIVMGTFIKRKQNYQTAKFTYNHAKMHYEEPVCRIIFLTSGVFNILNDIAKYLSLKCFCLKEFEFLQNHDEFKDD